MRFLCFLLILCGSGSLGAQPTTNTALLHNDVYNYTIPYRADVMPRGFDAWEEMAFLQDEQGKVLDVYRATLQLSADTEPVALTKALGGYETQSETFALYVRSIAGVGEQADLFPHFMHAPWIDQPLRLEAHDLGQTTAWLPEDFLQFEEYESPDQTQHLLLGNFAVQTGKQLLCFWVILVSDTEWTSSLVAKQLPSFLNQIEINGTRLVFSGSEDKGWQINGGEGSVTQTLPLDTLNQQVNKALAQADKQPTIAFGTKETYTDQGPYYHFSLPHDQLNLAAPSDVMLIFPSVAEQHQSPKSYALTDDYRLKSMSSIRIDEGEENYSSIDTLQAFRLRLGPQERDQPDELTCLSVKGKRWTPEDVRALYQAGVDSTRFRSTLAEELLPDGQTRLYYGTDLRAEFDPEGDAFPSFEQGPFTAVMLQRDDWLHIIRVQRTFAFQLIDLLARVDYNGFQFLFEQEGKKLRLKEVLRTGDGPAAEDLALVQAFRADYPVFLPKMAVSQNPPTSISFPTNDWATEYLTQLQRGTAPVIDPGAYLSVAAIHLADDAKSRESTRSRGLKVDFLVQPNSPYCYGLALPESDLVMTDNLGSILIGEGRFFPLDEYRTLQPEEEDEDFAMIMAGWFPKYTQLEGQRGFIAQAHSYVFPAPTAHLVHLQGTLYLKCYSEQLLTEEYPAQAAHSDLLDYPLENERVRFRKDKPYTDSPNPAFRFANQEDVPVLAIEFLDEDGNVISTHGAQDLFHFKQQDDGLFLVPRMRITYCQPQLVPLVIDEYVSLGF